MAGILIYICGSNIPKTDLQPACAFVRSSTDSAADPGWTDGAPRPHRPALHRRRSAPLSCRGSLKYPLHIKQIPISRWLCNLVVQLFENIMIR